MILLSRHLSFSDFCLPSHLSLNLSRHVSTLSYSDFRVPLPGRNLSSFVKKVILISLPTHMWCFFHIYPPLPQDSSTPVRYYRSGKRHFTLSNQMFYKDSWSIRSKYLTFFTSTSHYPGILIPFKPYRLFPVSPFLIFSETSYTRVSSLRFPRGKHVLSFPSLRSECRVLYLGEWFTDVLPSKGYSRRDSDKSEAQ